MIDTARLLLSPPDPASDFDAWAACFGDAEVMKGLGKARGLDRAQAWRNFALMLGHWHYHGFGMFSVRLKSTGEWVGRVGPWMPEGWPVREIGWTIARPYWGNGYAVEASRAAMDHARDTLGWDHAAHSIAADNHNSRRIAQKLGSVLEDLHGQVPVDGTLYPVEIWGQSLG